MDESQCDAGPALHERARWLHDVRNAVNTAGVAVALSRRLLGRGDTAAAADMLDVADEAWGRCRDLLAMQGDLEEAAGGVRLRPRGAAGPASPEPPARR